MSDTRNSRNTPSPAGTVDRGRIAASPLVAGRRHMASSRAIEFKPRRAPYVPAKAVGSFVPGLTKKTFEKFGFATAQLITDWSDVAGADVARYTVPERIRWPRLPMGGDETDGDGGRAATLLLRVDPARALDIEYKRALLIERINVYFGYRAVSDIRIVQGTVDAATAGAAAGKPVATVLHQPPATAAPTTDAAAIDTVADERLRQALSRMQASIRGGNPTR